MILKFLISYLGVPRFAFNGLLAFIISDNNSSVISSGLILMFCIASYSRSFFFWLCRCADSRFICIYIYISSFLRLLQYNLLYIASCSLISSMVISSGFLLISYYTMYFFIFRHVSI